MEKVRGFTLIELLVVIAIIAGLVGALIPQLSNFNKSQALQTSVLELQTVLRQAQNSATAGVVCVPATPAATWFVKFIGSSSYQVDTTCVLVTGATPTPTPVPSKIYSLPSGISIAEIKIEDGCGNSNVLSDKPQVSFGNISGEVVFTAEGVSDTCARSVYSTKMTITLSSASENIPLVVEKGGSIYVD